MLKQELLGRKRQTVIVAAGLAIAIALVIVVSALSAGVRQAQTEALENVYGVGTDLTVTGTPQGPGEGGGGPRFEFGEADGSTSNGTTTLNQSRLMSEPGRGTLDASVVETVAQFDGVASATGVLSLTNTSFSGELPDFSQMQEPDGPGGFGGQGQTPGGPDGQGGSAFGIESFTVLGVDPGVTTVGPLSATELTDGRGFSEADTEASVALLDSTYAASSELAVGDVVEVGGQEVEVIGIVASATDSADTAANLYLPIETARSLGSLDEVVSTVYATAASTTSIDSIQAAIETALPDATVSSQADLAEEVSGSLSSAASLISSLGTWLSVIVLGAALLIAMLLTSSGVARRTREFGTLKAIGWSNSRVVSQVAGESMVQSVIGGAVGLVLGLGAVGVINLISPTLSTSTSAPTDMPAGMGERGGFQGMPEGGMPSSFGQTVAESADIVLNAPVTPWVVAIAIGLAILGGLLAGAFGGWRAARLSPVEALRAVA